jgi:hypothetical protein
MAYGGYEASRRLGDYVSAVADALSAQNGRQLSVLLSVSRGAYCNVVAAGLDQNKVIAIPSLNRKFLFFIFFSPQFFQAFKLCDVM